MSAATSSNREPDEGLDGLLADRLPQILPDRPRVVSISPVQAPGGIHPNVRRIALSTGVSVIAKRHLFAALTAGQPHHLLNVERTVSDVLVAAGCPVPAVLATIDNHGVVVLEDVGTGTLDDFVQHRGRRDRARLADAVVDGFVRIQARMIDQTEVMEGAYAPGCDEESIREGFLELDAALGDGLASLVTDRSKVSSARGQLHRLVVRLSDLPTHLGPMDYNARNIVISGDGRPYFIEWSKIGRDWPERRIVQYLTSLGSGTKGGRPRSLIDPLIANRYAAAAIWSNPDDAAFALDAHHLIFHLLLASRYVTSTEQLPPTVAAALTTQLSPSPVTIGLRRLFT